MLKEVNDVYKLVFMSDKCLKSFMDILFPKNYQKEIAENTAKMTKLLEEKNQSL
ncbi:MAG: hypothetical protein ACI4R8_03390 [Candidatus Caccovivens sp.]